MSEDFPAEPEPTASQATVRMRRGPALILVVLTGLFALAAWWLLSSRDGPPADLWADGSYVADPDCVAGSSECPVFLESRPVGHGNTSEGDLALTAVHYPGLDDPIAQWGRCMDSVLTCLAPASQGTPDEKANALRACVAEAECPQACRDRFADRADDTLEGATAEFDAIFVAEEAWCAPVQ
ncbi:hypothetical protein [Maricaulis maris]|uniref:hypothetical protein n=1 Tax=Maricaulis maris TaxID=74318 RepID=UPI003B8B7C2E